MPAWRADATNQPLVSDCQHSIEELVLLLTRLAKTRDSATNLTLPYLPRGRQNAGALTDA